MGKPETLAVGDKIQVNIVEADAADQYQRRDPDDASTASGQGRPGSQIRNGTGMEN
jgi:hypothetical protein